MQGGAATEGGQRVPAAPATARARARAPAWPARQDVHVAPRAGRASGVRQGGMSRARTVVEDGRLLPGVLRRRRLDQPLEGELDARGDDGRGDTVSGHLNHVGLLVVDDVEAGAVGQGARRSQVQGEQKTAVAGA